MPKKSRLDGVLEAVLGEITPTGEELAETQKVIEDVLKAVEKVTKKHKLTYVLAGSFIRNTWLPDKKEFDIFICFPETLSRNKLEEKGLLVGKKIAKEARGRYVIAYAEHPYVKARIQGYDVDIVPCYAVKSASQIKSAVDRTPFHNRWLEKHLDEKLVPDVRLFKQFCKGMKIYGSDTKTEGLSGYLCELLIIYFGGFKKLLEGISKWEPGSVLIDLEKHHPKGEIPEELKSRFRDQPLIVIDPVDPKRNVAAAFSSRNFMKLVEAAREFLKKPDKGYFFRKISVDYRKLENEIKKRETKLILLVFRHPNVIVDVLWPQMRRTARRLANIMDDNEFKVMGFDVWSDDREKCAILLELEVSELPEIKEVEGPLVFMKQRALEFRSKYEPIGKVWVEDDYWKAEVKREFTRPEELLKGILKNSENRLKENGIASYIAKSVSKRFEVMDEKKILEMARQIKEFGEFLQEYFEKEK